MTNQNQDLRRSEATVRAIVETAVTAIITIDDKGIVCSFNPAAEHLFQYQQHEIIGQNVKILMPEPFHSEHDGYLSRYMKEGKPRIMGSGREVICQRKDYSTFPADLAVSEIAIEGEWLFVGILTDISEQKRTEKRLAEAKEAAEEGVRIKAAFVANISHEIRTPMNAILGFSEVVLQDKNLSSDSLKNVRIIFSAAKSLLGIINDVLDVSKMESGKFSLETVCFNLHSVLNDSIRTFESKAAERDLMLSFDYDSELPLRFMGDPTRLRQVILNLVGNSIKFTQEGSVKLTVEAGEKANMLHFSVIDTGIGMTESQIATVFEAFSQADASTTRRFGGTGLGTSISKQIVELMNGKIWIESVFGEGTTFHFNVRLPVATNIENCLFDDSNDVSSRYISPRLFNILLAEDIDVNARLVTLRLEQQGHTIHWAKNGREAVNAFNADNYDLILMDVQMPELDGLGATLEIRALEAKAGHKKRISILALTASVLHDEKMNCIEAGMDSIVSKPIEFGELLSTMEKIIPADVGKIRTVELIETNLSSRIDFSPLNGVIDYEKGLKMWNDSLAYSKALISFAAEHRDDANKMAAKLDDDVQLRQMAHAIKGVSGNLAMINVPVIVGEIEAALMLGQQENLAVLLSQLKAELEHVVAAITQLQLPITTQIAPTKSFDKNDLCQLFRQLFKALKELNPDVVEPVLSSLGAYLDEKELTKIRRGIDNFDFEEATNQTHVLVNKLDLIIE